MIFLSLEARVDHLILAAPAIDDDGDLEFRQDLDADNSDDEWIGRKWLDQTLNQALDFFNLILDENCFQLLVDMTNKYG